MDGVEHPGHLLMKDGAHQKHGLKPNPHPESKLHHALPFADPKTQPVRQRHSASPSSFRPLVVRFGDIPTATVKGGRRRCRNPEGRRNRQSEYWRCLSGPEFWSSRLPCSVVSQLPTRTPSRRTPFTRRMRAANSGLSSPESAASYATRWTAASRRLMVAGSVLLLLKINSIPEHDVAVEGQAWLRAIPLHEFVDGMIVRSLATLGSQTVQHSRLGLFKVRTDPADPGPCTQAAACWQLPFGRCGVSQTAGMSSYLARNSHH